MAETINGFKFQLILKDLQAKRAMLEARFPREMWAFEGETKSPAKVAADLGRLEHAIVRAQVALAKYNTQITIDWAGGCSLLEAIKLLGTYARLQRLWQKTISSNDEGPRWMRKDEEKKRDKDSQYAIRSMDEDTCQANALGFAKDANRLRALVQAANASEVSTETIGFEWFAKERESLLG